MVFPALLVIGLAGIGIGCKQRGSDVREGERELIEAFSKRRMIEPRLSGGFKCGQFNSSNEDRSGIKDDKLDRASELIMDAAVHNGAANQRAYARLLLSKNDKVPQAAAFLRRALVSEPDSAETHNDLGVCLIQQGKVEDALDELEAALKLKVDMPEALFNRALCYVRLRLREAADVDLVRLLQVEHDEGWRDEAQRRLNELTTAADPPKPISEILSELNDALTADPIKAREIVDRNYEAARRYFFYDLAPEYLRLAIAGDESAAALDLARIERIGSLAVETKGDHDIEDIGKSIVGCPRPRRADELRLLQDYRAALAPFETRKYDEGQAALEGLQKRLRTPDDLLFQAKVKYGIARALYQARHFGASSRLLEGVLPVLKERGWRYHEAQALDLLGLNLSRLGQDSKAIKYFKESYEMFQQMREPVATPLQYVGVTYWHLGNFDEALKSFGDSTDQFLKQGVRPGELAYNYLNVADIYRLLEKTQLALLFADEALEYSNQAKDLNRAAQALSFKAVEHGRLEQFDLASEGIEKAVQLLSKIGSADRAYTAPLVMLRAGEVALQRGDAITALQHYSDAEALTSQAEGDPILHMNALRGRAEAYAKAGQRDHARADLGEAIRIIEDYLKNLNERFHRIDFLAASNSVFDQMIALDAIEPGQAREAFEISERSRARNLLDEFAPNRSSQIEPCSLPDAQAALPEKLALLAYSVTSARTHVFLITRTRFEITTTPVTDRQLSLLVNDYVDAIKVNAPIELLSKQSRDLYELLIGPVRNRLNGITELCIVPDKSMQLLPMSALKDQSDRYLVETFPIVYAPSVSVFIRCLRRAGAGARGEEHLVAVGNPEFDREQFENLADLEDAVREARSASEAYHDPVVLTGAKAVEPDVRDALKTCTVAHLASHCLIDPQSPWLAALVLAPQRGSPPHDARSGATAGPGDAQVGAKTTTRARDLSASRGPFERALLDDPTDGLLYLNEIYNLKLPNARLIVLSACETGLGRYYRGEGIVSLIHPFLAAQVSTVVASLWPVTSRATAELMIEFHKERRGSEMRSGDALRASQLKMIRNGEFTHPYYWASFIVVGGNY